MQADEADGQIFHGVGGADDRLGARLSAARRAANIELADIARETRVPLRHLRALEADAHDELPALPYSIGFVKSFARIVGIDPEEAATRFRAETSKTAHVPAMTELEPLDERRLPPRGLVLASVVVLVLLLGGLTAYGAGWLDTPTPPAEAPLLAEAPVLPEAAVAPPPVAPPPTAGPVSIVATEEAWVRIYRISAETGRRESVKEGVLAKGERYDVPPEMPGLKLWTGRAGALQVSVGGRALPPLGGPVETVSAVSLAPADLAARLAAAVAVPPAVAAPAVQ